jgi:hypothetical protein
VGEVGVGDVSRREGSGRVRIGLRRGSEGLQDDAVEGPGQGWEGGEVGGGSEDGDVVGGGDAVVEDGEVLLDRGRVDGLEDDLGRELEDRAEAVDLAGRAAAGDG